MTTPTLSKIKDPNSCSNCVSLRWGPEEGWDKCEKHGIGVYWADKAKQICSDHKRSNLKDPRNPEPVIESFDDWFKSTKHYGCPRHNDFYDVMEQAWNAALKHGVKK